MSSPRERSSSVRRRRIVGVALAAALIVSGSVVMALRPWERGVGDEPLTGAPPAEARTAVCGFDGPLVSAITADRPKDDPARIPAGPRVADRGEDALGMWRTGDGVSVLWSDRNGFQVTRYAADGSETARLVVHLDQGDEDFHSNGSIGMSRDGTMYIIDTYQGRRQLVRFAPDGARQWSVDVPDGAETTGHPLDLDGSTWVADLDGRPAILLTEGAHTTHVFREDGSYDGTSPVSLASVVSTDGSVVFGATSGAEGGSQLVGWDAARNADVLRAVTPIPGDASEVGHTPGLPRLIDVARGPNGRGFLLLDARGIEWIDADGIRQGVWAYAGGLTTHRLIHGDGTYWLLADGDDEDAAQQMIRLTDDDMAVLLASPTSLTAGNADDLAILGIGIGAMTRATLNHFDDGRSPEVVVRAEAGWGELTAGLADTVELRYTVTADPRLALPTESTSGTARVPVGGGEIPLTLPPTQPGAYLVSVSLVDTESGVPLSGQCLHYSVGAPGSALDLDGLAEGADWGGARPLRGAQLADRLGVRSHRIQLDFGALVSDPAGTPSRDGVDWTALPGSDVPADGDASGDLVEVGFAELTRAAQYASAHGVDLIVQVGQGGRAEMDAVDAGTWTGWVRVIVAEFASRVPSITIWEPWNEPNNSFGSGGEYTTKVDVPFRTAARDAAPRATVISGNTLGFDEAWWRDAVAAGICTGADALAVHPYTGWNRSWEEEGFAAPGAGFDSFRAALGDGCAALPLWDTETGWTSDGDTAFWAQGSDVARKLLWYNEERVAGWTYFFSEGGWGENGLSWSLVQVGRYVKPGGLAFASVSRLIDGKSGSLTETGIPNTYAMRFSGGDGLLAAWTDDLRVDTVVTADAASIEAIDQYGAAHVVELDDGKATIPLSGSPLFLRAPGGAEISLSPTEPFGPDLLAGRDVAASSTHEESDPGIITSGTVNPYQPWRSGRMEDGSVDDAPSVEISFGAPTTIDRIAVASGSIICCQSGLRDYVVEARTADGEWHTVAEQRDQFVDRVVLFRFDPLDATAVRVTVPWTTVRGVRVLDVNATGFAGGLPPPFLGLQTESDYVVAIAAVQAWSPG